ncbi:MAG: Proprotein convertase in/kexin type 6 [Acidimicrobiales bacterium]|nr:Proprotein convertase in/kexin type 6 [Acidimicrobiales bacterium]
MLGDHCAVRPRRGVRLLAGAAAVAVSLTLGAPVAGAAAVAASSPRHVRAFSTEWDAQGHLRVVHYQAEVTNAPAAGAMAASSAPGASVASTETDSVVRALGATDPMRSQQWALNQVSFEASWPLTRGGGVIVAVVDTGVRGDHEDLGATVLHGIDLVNAGGDGRTDANGHGTHVAGIIAAAASNGRGIAGGAPGVKILPVRVLDAQGQGFSSNVAQGIIWATDHGARVINLSLGGSTASQGTRTAIQYANSKGAIVLAAAGNAGANGNAPMYPGAFPEAVAVAAVDQQLGHASFSNSGSYVDIAAPGVGVLSTWGSSPTAYAYADGTSMATPYASAAAALVASINPAISAAGIANVLEASARDLGAPGTDPYFGHGLINPRDAVLRAQPKPPGYGTKGNGYWVVTANGQVRGYGKAHFFGDLRGRAPGTSIVASASTANGGGYWLAGADGSVYAFGNAHFYGSMSGRHLNAPIVGMSPSPTGRGYLLLGADGGIFTFGDASFHGSTGAMRLAAPVLDMTMTRSGRGYWMVAADGGVFTFGDAKFRGSTGNLRLASPVVSMTAGTHGYWLVARDGGIFAFGVPFVGSLPGLGVASTPFGARIRALGDGKGYYILGTDGAVFTFGTAKFFGASPASWGAPAIDLMLAP